MCMNCTSDFSLTLRRHHCHSCGRVSRAENTNTGLHWRHCHWRCCLCWNHVLSDVDCLSELLQEQISSEIHERPHGQSVRSLLQRAEEERWALILQHVCSDPFVSSITGSLLICVCSRCSHAVQPKQPPPSPLQSTSLCCFPKHSSSEHLETSERHGDLHPGACAAAEDGCRWMDHVWGWPLLLVQVTVSEEGSISGSLQRSKKSKRSWKRLWFLLKDKVLYTYRAQEVRRNKHALAMQTKCTFSYLCSFSCRRKSLLRLCLCWGSQWSPPIGSPVRKRRPASSGFTTKVLYTTLLKLPTSTQPRGESVNAATFTETCFVLSSAPFFTQVGRRHGGGHSFIA